MKEWIEKFLQSLPNPNTVAAYRNDLTQFAEFLATFQSAAAPPVTRLADATAEHFQEYRFFLQERGYAKTTLARKLAAVRALYRYLEAQFEAKAEATQALGNQPVERPAPATLTRAEILDLLQAPRRAPGRYPVRDTAMLYLLYYTELRATTLLSLNLGDVAQDGTSLQVEGANGKRITLAQPAQSALSSLMDELRTRHGPEDQPLFQNHRGDRLTRQGLWTIVKRYTPFTDIKGHLTLETLRHSRAAHRQPADQ